MKYGILAGAALAAAMLAMPAQALEKPEVRNLPAEFDTPVTPVPEPATWAMMISGFGLIGVALRRRAAVTA